MPERTQNFICFGCRHSVSRSIRDDSVTVCGQCRKRMFCIGPTKVPRRRDNRAWNVLQQYYEDLYVHHIKKVKKLKEELPEYVKQFCEQLFPEETKDELEKQESVSRSEAHETKAKEFRESEKRRRQRRRRKRGFPTFDSDGE